MRGMPRFQGKAIQYGDKWGWECYVSMIGEGEATDVIVTNDRFETKQEAITDMRAVIESIASNVAKKVNATGDIIDLKNNTTRKID